MKFMKFFVLFALLLVEALGTPPYDHGLSPVDDDPLFDNKPSISRAHIRRLLGKRPFQAPGDEPRAKEQKVPAQETMVETLIDSLRTGDAVRVREIAGQMESLNVLGREGLSPLHVASFLPNGCAAIKFLIERGANINVPSQNGELPIHHAIRGLPFRVRGGAALYDLDQDNIGCLLAHGPFLNSVALDGYTTLTAAIEMVMSMVEESQRAHLVYQLINRLTQRGSSPEELFTLPPERQEQLLRISIQQGDLSLTKYLVSHATREYVSRLELASWEWMFILSDGTSDTLKIILEKGYPVNKPSQNLRAGCCVADVRQSTTLLHLAVIAANVDAVKLLLASGADQRPTFLLGSTPLMLAAGAESGVKPVAFETQQKLVEIARILVISGALIDAQDALGNTALLIAVKHNLGAVAKVLIDAGADTTIRNRAGVYLVET